MGIYREPVRRERGDHLNWQANAHGKGADDYSQSHPNSSCTPGATADSFVADSKNGGAQTMITVPTIGWVPKLGSGRSIIWSYSVSKYGPETASIRIGPTLATVSAAPITMCPLPGMTRRRLLPH